VGLTRQPLMSASDEVMINAAAWTWAKTGHLANQAYGDTLGMKTVFAHHPPVYLFLQRIVYAVFGVGPFTTRMVSYFFAILTIGVFALLLAGLARQDYISWGSATLAVACLSFSFVLFRCLRMGRMETTGMFFAILSVWIATLPDRKRTAAFLFGVCSAILLALAVGCHVEFLLYSPLLFSIWVARRAGRPMTRLVIAASLALLSALAFWNLWFWATFPHFKEGLIQFCRIVREVGGWAEIPRQLRAFCLQHLGFADAALSLAVLMVCGYLLIADRHKRAGIEWCLMASPFIGVIMFFSVVPFDYKAALVFSPVFLLAGAHCLTDLVRQGSKIGRVLFAVFLLTVLINAGLDVLYLQRLVTQWDRRAPLAYMTVLEDIPRGSVIAGEHRLWVAATMSKINLRVINFGFPPDAYFWKTNTGKIKDFEFVVLHSSHPLTEVVRESADFGIWKTYRLNLVGDPQVIVYRRHCNINR